MNPNLLNPVIVTRQMEEREMELRRRYTAANDVEGVSGRPAPPKSRAPAPLQRWVLAWLAALIR